MVPSRIFDAVDQARVTAAYRGLLGGLMSRQAILGQCAILDCLVDDDLAAQWHDRCTELGARLSVFECICSDEKTHRSRIEGRVRGIPGWHEVDWAHVERMKDVYPPLQFPHVTLDSMNPLDDNVGKVLASLS